MKKHSLHDDIYIIDDFLTSNECSDLIKIAKNCKQDDIYDENWAYKGFFVNPAYKTTINKGQYKLVTSIEERLASIVDVPIENQENFQVFRSDPSVEGFFPHIDTLATTSPYYKETQKSGNRILAAIFYLSDVAEAGETYFTHFKSKVKPKIGRLLVYKPEITHEALPVKKGIKWIFIKFMREHPVKY